MALYNVRRTFLSRKLKNIRYFSLSQVSHQEDLAEIDSDLLGKNKDIESDLKSIYRRGYLRSEKPYSPPKNVTSIISNICENYSLQEGGSFADQQTKFNILKECFKVLNHSVPNSLLHKINNTDELLMFYQTEVSSTVPLDEMKHIALPKNLHVLYDYVRFHPETDTMFGGISAFPESSTVMSDLKAKKKYPGYDAKKKSLG